ncbi:UNVERIFIED_ORG: putative MnhB-related membrane protein [Bacillus proteolyticus]|uniref:DUF4236 domain-containing protein n=1 Tax=Bacillus cereus TaxID=1396 RepID=UPI000BF83DA9|nr:DUF4236 domain-containing protein [Bacillus cereus]PFQ01446.1 hypothetical protein COK12_26395 [Bacillus cereus]
MGFRFRKSIKIAPGVKLNVSKRGVGVSAGVKGANVSVGPSGSRITTSIPGTGLSYEKRLNSKKGGNSQVNNLQISQDNQHQINNYQVFEVNAVKMKDNKANSIARKMMIPLIVMMCIITVISLLIGQFIFAGICAIIGYFCYKNIKAPDVAICPACNRQHPLVFKQKKVRCFCKSTLIIK